MTSMLPDISVIVACYNHGRWIERCIRSLSHQRGHSDFTFEIIVVDDGSLDNTGAVLKNLQVLENLRIIRNEENRGLPASLNVALHRALGRYIVRVDSDDYVAREFLYTMKLFLDTNRKYQAVAIDYVRVDEFEIGIERVNAREHEIACGIMYRKECLFDIGLYNEDFRMREGHELNRRFREKYKMAYLEFPFYKYRDHRENRTKNLDEVEKYDQKLAE